MVQVILPNSTENATYNDFCGLKIIQPPNRICKTGVVSHLMQLVMGFISCTRCAWARTHEIYPNWL